MEILVTLPTSSAGVTCVRRLVGPELGVLGLAVASAPPEGGNQQERRQQAYRQEDAEAHHGAPGSPSGCSPAAGLGPIAGPDA